jgi:hypothetical protein
MSNTFQMRRDIVEVRPGRTVALLDTIAHVEPQDEGRIVVAGSHGGVSSGEYAARVRLAAVFFNDAGFGKEDAGCAALALLDAKGIAAGTVSHDSAMIGNAEDGWEGGIISALNASAQAMGFRVGQPLQQAVRNLPEAAHAS